MVSKDDQKKLDQLNLPSYETTKGINVRDYNFDEIKEKIFSSSIQTFLIIKFEKSVLNNNVSSLKSIKMIICHLYLIIILENI